MPLLEALLVDPAGHQIHRTLMQERQFLLLLLLCLRRPLLLHRTIEKLVLQVRRTRLLCFISLLVLLPKYGNDIIDL
jgi:hypothetical protein